MFSCLIFPISIASLTLFTEVFSGENAHPKFGVLINTTITSTALVLAYLHY